MYENFDKDFSKFIPIIRKASGKYRLKGFDHNDYIQEGRLIYFELLSQNLDESSMYVFFKVKYSQHLINLMRRQKAYKRSFDGENYIDISSVSNQIADRSQTVENELLVSDTISSFAKGLRKNDRQLLLNLLEGKEISRVQKHRLKQKLIHFLNNDKPKR